MSAVYYLHIQSAFGYIRGLTVMTRDCACRPVIIKGKVCTWLIFLPYSQREKIFMPSYMLSCTPGPSGHGFYSEWNEFVPQEKSRPFKIDPIDKGDKKS